MVRMKKTSRLLVPENVPRLALSLLGLMVALLFWFSGNNTNVSLELLEAATQEEPPQVTFMVLADPPSLKRYKNNLDSIECYTKLQGYRFVARDVSETCRQKGVSNFFFLKHCTVLEEMESDPEHPNSWYVVLDGDTGVVNFNHRVEEYIALGNHKDVVHGLRFHNNEVFAGGYLVKNSNFGRSYLKEWVGLHPDKPHQEYGGANFDNGALHWLLLHRLSNSSTPGFQECRSIGKGTDYRRFIECFHDVIKQTHCQGHDWPHVAVLAHGESFAEDNWVSYGYWSNHTFLQHALKPGTPPDRTCCKRPVLNPQLPAIQECTREMAFSGTSGLMGDWYVAPETYQLYRNESLQVESRRHNPKSWDSKSCGQNGKNAFV